MKPTAETCIYCKENTARKKGTNTLSGGKKQQIWHCRNCGRTWQTSIGESE